MKSKKLRILRCSLISSSLCNLHIHPFVKIGLIRTMSTAVKRKAVDLAAEDAKKPKSNSSITSFFGAPKSSSTSSSGVAAKATTVADFDKEKWVESLTAEQKELLKLEIDTLHESWLPYLKDEILSKEFLELKRFLKKEKTSGKAIYPPPGDIYSW